MLTKRAAFMIHAYGKLPQTTIGVDGEDWITLPPAKTIESTNGIIIKVYNRVSLINYLMIRFNFVPKNKVKNALATISTKIG
jgi:hypothetical protein